MDSEKAITTATREETARERLRSQKMEYEKAMRQAGHEAGCKFVLDTGEQDDAYAQLVSLERHQEHHDYPENLADLIAAMNATDAGLEDYFRENCGGDCEEAEWLIGFVSGALAKFRELAS